MEKEISAPVKPIPYGRQWITEEDIAVVVETLNSDFLTQGPKISEFENKFAEYIGCKYAVVVSNGTAALHLAALALNVAEGTRVITTPITFAASANCILYCGGQVEFADIDPETALLDINKVRALLESKPKGYYSGVIPVDFAGYPINLEAFRKLADEYGLWIIEDACHAPGGFFTDSEGKAQWCGNGVYADAAVFSFHPVKHIATGEGGMITTNSEEIYQKLLLLRTHGITKNPNLLQENHGGWYYEMQTLGYNYRLPDMLAALGITQLAKADAGIARRIEIAQRYDEALASNRNISILNPLPCQVQLEKGINHAYHLYIIRTLDRAGLYKHLKDNNVFAQVHYIPVHTMPFYKNLGWKKGDFPEAEHYYDECISLPMYPALKDEELDFVIKLINDFHE